MRERSEFAGEEPGAARTAGLRRLSRLTWRATQLSAVTTVGFATFFARTAPAQTAAGDGTAAAAVKTSPPVAAAVKTSPPATSSSGRAYPRRARASASARARALAQPTPQAAARPTAQATIMSSKTAGPAPSMSATLAPPSTAPAAAPSTSSAPAPTVSSTSHGGG